MKARTAVRVVCVYCIISVFFNIWMGIRIVRMDKDCHRKHIDEINRELDWYPDADAATEIAEACIGMDKSQAEAVYDVQITYSKQNHEWLVTFEPKGESTEDRRVIGIRKDNGLIAEYDE